jgi:HlyD family secretion protein
MMVYSYRYIFCIFFIISLQSCLFKKKNDIFTCKVERNEFTEVITVPGTVEAVKSNSIRCPNVYRSSILFLVEDGTFVNAGDTVCILENKEMVDQYEQMQKNIELQKAELNKSKADLDLKYALLEAEVKNNDAQTAITNLDSLQLKFSSEVQQKITALELKIASIKKNRYEKKLAALELINKSELRKTELQIVRMENQLKTIEDRLKLLVILSPQNGLFIHSNSITGQGKTKEGDQTYPGITIAEIPDLSAMRVYISASEKEYKRVMIDDSVIFTFDALLGNFCTGKVTYKAPVGKSKNENSKVKFYDLLASIDSCMKMPGAGLSANCKIFAERISDTLIAPFISVFDEDSLKYVYVKTGIKYEKREVIVSESSPESAVISAGILEGEILALSKPNERKVGKTVKLSGEVKENVKRMQALKQSKLAPQINRDTPRSNSGGSSVMIIYM